jgi:hypothetical protein
VWKNIDLVRAATLLITVLTGFAALVYQVVWHRYLAVLLGSHSEATAAVLAIFLGGLSGGYALFGRVSSRLVARGDENAASLHLRVYGAVEIAIGLYALVFPARRESPAREAANRAPGERGGDLHVPRSALSNPIGGLEAQRPRCASAAADTQAPAKGAGSRQGSHR